MRRGVGALTARNHAKGRFHPIERHTLEKSDPTPGFVTQHPKPKPGGSEGGTRELRREVTRRKHILLLFTTRTHELGNIDD